jgi:MoaA/NifB/PqqE/SkfB family radical SAM enzyme
MNARDYLTHILPRVIKYKLTYLGWREPINPMTLTFSVTNLCQSRCQTCNIWEVYKKQPDLRQDELSLDEIERIFCHIGPIYFFNISGGEPFLRPDLPEIVGLAIDHMRPRIIHTPTNAISPGRVEEGVIRILDIMASKKWQVPFTVKPSLDGVGEMHDKIRGVPGNFDKVMDTVERLKRVRQGYPNLHVELGTVVSKMNMYHLEELADFVHSLEGIESYRNEIAEERAEFFNQDTSITPTADEYAELMKGFSQRIWANTRAKRELARVTEALRLVYYKYAARIMKENRQVLPCYGGVTNAHINPYGQVWPCAVLGYDQPMGDLKDHDYDFHQLWNSEQARQVRAYIKAHNCACPLANQSYSNILCSAKATTEVIVNVVRLGL